MNPTRNLCWLTPFAAALVLSGCGSSAASASDEAKLFSVQKGPLSVLVTEAGEIAASQSTRVKSEMEGSATIIFLVEEGKIVEKGEKLVELDASELHERRANQGIALAKADAALVQARKSLEITTKQVESDNLAAKNALKIAELEQEKFLGRLHPDNSREMGMQLQELEQQTSEIKLAQENLKLAKDTMEWSQKLFDKGWITKNEVERDQIGFQEREVRVKVAQNQLEILERFTHVQKQLELEQALVEAQIKVEQTIAKGEATIAQATAELVSSEAEHVLAKDRFENIEKQIKNATLVAPTKGLVVYASDGGMRGRGNNMVEEGAQVRERQTLIILPDISRMIAELKIHEAFIDKVQIGQLARIKVDAFDTTFTGRVRRVSPVADTASRWGNSDIKLYKTEVEIDGVNTLLRPGMSAEVQVVVAEIDDVLSVPVHSVRRHGAVPYVWLKTPQGPVARQVALGTTNYSFVQITDGLQDGDQIYQAAPPGVKAPEFEQPEQAKPTEAVAERRPPGPADASSSEADNAAAPAADLRGDGAAAGGGERRRRGEGGMAGAQKLLDRFKEKYPDLAERAADARALFTDQEIRTLIQEDAELKAMSDALMSQMRGGRGRGNRGGANEDGGGATDEQRRGGGNDREPPK